MELSPGSLHFVLLPSKNPPANFLCLHNNAYQLWKKVWLDTFSRLALSAENLNGEFGRQDLVACIARANEPLAIHLYSFYAVDSLAAREHPYLSGNYPDAFFLKLREAGVRTVMSMEYMTVHPEHRKGSCNVHLGMVLGGLAHYTMEAFRADAAIAPARRDRKVNELAFAFGGEAVLENVINHNIPCDLVMTRRENIRLLSDYPTQALLDRLWRERQIIPAIVAPPAEGGVLPFKRAA